MQGRAMRRATADSLGSRRVRVLLAPGAIVQITGMIDAGRPQIFARGIDELLP